MEVNMVKLGYVGKLSTYNKGCTTTLKRINFFLNS